MGSEEDGANRVDKADGANHTRRACARDLTLCSEAKASKHYGYVLQQVYPKIASGTISEG